MSGNNLSSSESKRKAGSLLLILAFVFLCLAIIGGSAFYYANYEKKFRDRAAAQLSAIAELKVSGLLEWRKDRLAEASIFYRNDNFEGMVKRYVKNPGDGDARERLLTWLGRLKAVPHYDRIFLLDTRGNELLSIPDLHDSIAAHIPGDIARVLRSGKVTFLDFHRDAPGRPIHLTLMVPLFDEKDNNRPLAVLVLRINPYVYLYPFIQKWPVPSKTSETLIARREGNSALFLNELKFQKNTALRLTIPLDGTEMPAVQAVLGFKGIMEGIDYRGHRVLAALRAIPGSPWFLVARTDITEIYAPLRERFWQMAVFICLILSAIVGCLFLLLRQQRLQYYREKLEIAEALRESERKLSEAQKLAQLGHWDWDIATGKVVWSDEVYRIFQLDSKNFTPHIDSILELSPWPEDHERDKELIRRAMESHEKGSYVQRFLRPDKSIGYYDSTFQGKYDDRGNLVSIVGTVQDISVRKRTEMALRESERKFRDTIKHLDEGYYSCTEEGLLLEHNLAFNRILGFDPSLDMKGKKLPDFWLNPDDRKEYLDELMIKGAIANYLINAKKDSGEKIVVLANAHLIKDEKDKVVKIEGTFTDFTERKRLEEKLQQNNTQLEQKTRDLEQLIFVTSHDLRTPLVNVQGFAKELARSIVELMESIQSGDISAEAARRIGPILKKDIPESLEYIQSGIARMDMQLSALLKLSRLGRAALTVEKIDMNGIIAETVKSLEYVIQEKGADVTVAELPPCMADAAQMSQIFINLIENALKYLDAKRPGVIRISGNRQGNEVVYCVEDNGVGVAPEYQERIFEIFYRVGHDNIPGEGLGLTIVRQGVEKLNGKVWVESEAGKGSRFFIRLPGV